MTFNHPVKEGNTEMGSLLAGALSAGLLMSMLGKTEACDSMLYMSSEGKMYEDNMMVNVATGLTTFHVGATICL